MIDAIKDGSLLFAYYPAPQWLSASRFLGANDVVVATR